MSPNPPPEEKLFLNGPAGRLEAIFRPTADGHEVGRVALLCHPHPLFGGTMMNKTLYRIAKRLPTELGIPVLRFNFRGAGASEGVYDGGRAEAEDVRCALDWLEERFPGCPILLVGYSFGAVVGLDVGNEDSRVDQLAGLGLPLHHDWDLSFMERLTRPVLLVHGERDEFGPAVDMQKFVDSLESDVELEVIPTASHLFRDLEDLAVDAITRRAATLVGKGPFPKA